MKSAVMWSVALAFGAAVMSSPATAASFPEKGKNVTIIVPTAPGGPSDVGARIMAGEMEKILGVPVQVSNKPGATGLIGLTEMARSKPDGYTISSFAVIAHVSAYMDESRRPAFGRKDIQPVGAYGEDEMLMTVKGDSPYKDLPDFIAAAKASPGKISVAASGIGGGPYLCWLMVEEAAGIDLNIVQFNGGAAMQTALAGGHVNASLAGAAGAISLAKSGIVRGIGLTGPEPNAFFPDVPTFKSHGIDIVYSALHGFAAPAGVPEEVIKVLTDAVEKSINSAHVHERMRGIGQLPRYYSPSQFGQRWAEAEKLVKYGLEMTAKDRRR